MLPCWLRDTAEPAASLLVGVRTGGDAGPVVLLSSPRLLAGCADELVGER